MGKLGILFDASPSDACRFGRISTHNTDAVIIINEYNILYAAIRVTMQTMQCLSSSDPGCIAQSTHISLSISPSLCGIPIEHTQHSTSEIN